MARRKISIDDRIEQQKLVVSKAKDRYEAELEQLNQLMKKRDELRNKELLQAIEHSSRSFEKSWISLAPMTPRIKPGSHRELIFQKVHIRARKGVGKSALLNYTAIKVSELYQEDFIINIKASELIAPYDREDYQPLQYSNCWQQRICMRILNEIAKKIKCAMTDDTMSIIETAEIMGYKGKNLFSEYNIDGSQQWEIHPAYRTVLKIK